jgi:hypothetical protein
MRAISSAVRPSATAQRSGSRRRVTPADAPGRSPLGTIPMRADNQCCPPPGGAKTLVLRRQQNNPRNNALQRVAQCMEQPPPERIGTRGGRVRWQAGGNPSASHGLARPRGRVAAAAMRGRGGGGRREGEWKEETCGADRCLVWFGGPQGVHGEGRPRRDALKHSDVAWPCRQCFAGLRPCREAELATGLPILAD